MGDELYFDVISGFYKTLSGKEVQATYQVLSTSGNITLMWHFLFTLITTGIVISGVRKGIEKWAKIMTKMLLVILVLLFLYTITLDGFGKAVEFIFYINPEDFKLSSVIEALGLAFWTLSIGQGIMISYGSYMKRTDSILQMSCIVAFAVVVVAILAALTIFPIVFTFNLPPESGPGLIFQTLPYLFAQLPGSLVLSTLFFTLFVFAALTSAIPLIEVVATNLMEMHNLTRKKSGHSSGKRRICVWYSKRFCQNRSHFPWMGEDLWDELFRNHQQLGHHMGDSRGRATLRHFCGVGDG